MGVPTRPSGRVGFPEQGITAKSPAPTGPRRYVMLLWELGGDDWPGARAFTAAPASR